MNGNSRFRRAIGFLLVIGLLVVLGGLAGAKGIIRITSPAPGATVSGEVLVKVEIENADVSYVIFGVDGSRPHATNCKPYSFPLDTAQLSEGAHTLYAEAYSRFGLLGRSSPIRVYVKNVKARPAQKAGQQVKADPPVETVAKESEIVDLTPALTSRAASPLSEKPASSQNFRFASRFDSAVLTMPVGEVVRAKPDLAETTPVVSALLPAVEPASAVNLEPGRPQIMINGNRVSLETPPAIRRGRMVVGFREMMDLNGWRVEWMHEQKAGVATGQGRHLVARLGERQATLNGISFDLGEEITLHNDRLVVPVRPICQKIGIPLFWDQETRTAKLIISPVDIAREMAAAN